MLNRNENQKWTNLRGHLGVPDTVSGPLIVPSNYLVILHLIGDSKHMTSEIECFQRYWNSASRTPRCPLKPEVFKTVRTRDGISVVCSQYPIFLLQPITLILPRKVTSAGLTDTDIYKKADISEKRICRLSYMPSLVQTNFNQWVNRQEKQSSASGNWFYSCSLAG